ncbi:hypothetical protein [Amnibacterium kyonggiense]|uniref:Dolichyl-phosphate-mannose-protein mannosyltransferase n=1 Tax=Amnibacterium kyonggiense TaxID=595671 RepID=A0A4V3EB58_9MICO|nr:hypothetical protein [Amnibacterium kyonggiense]TDS80424.1 hypothetical protein CLV52_0987 [Amnibacterium kyonggiense]
MTLVSASPVALAPGTGRTTTWSAAVVATAIGIGLLGASLRFVALLRTGGPLGMGGYDDGVDYAAAAALVHGRLPYRSFLLLHPPGVVLAAAPFAAIGSVFGDRVGFVAARLAFEALGGLGAALAFVALRRFGPTAAVTGGVLLAVLPTAVYAERSVLLEPLGSIGVLLAIVLLGRGTTPGAVFAAGVAAGWAVDVKIWYVVPAVVLWLAGTRRRGWFAAGAATAVLVVCGPFLAAAPVAMVREVVLDQMGRARVGRVSRRITEIVGAIRIGPIDAQLVAGALLALVLGALVVTALTAGARVFALLLAADLVVLLAAPSWFPHYADLAAPAIALCVGVAAQRATDLLPAGAARRWAAAGLVVAIGVGGTVAALRAPRGGETVPASVVAAVGRTSGCVVTDDPTLLAITGVLSRDLADPDCPVRPDVTGWTYDADRAPVPGVPRKANARWQRDVLGYLLSGRTVIVVRPATGLSSASRARLAELPVVHATGPWVLRATGRP